MKTKKLDVNLEQRLWMEQHKRADEIVCDTDSIPIRAVYYSPLKKWDGLIDPDGFVSVPDMDYYNNIGSTQEIENAIKDLSFHNQEPIKPA